MKTIVPTPWRQWHMLTLSAWLGLLMKSRLTRYLTTFPDRPFGEFTR